MEPIANGIEFTKEALDSISGVDTSDLAYVSKNNKALTNKTKYLLKELGYRDFYDLALATLSREQKHMVAKGGNKDLSRLTPVERTVIRNGKPMKMKIYVDSNKENENDLDQGSESSSRQQMQAQDLVGSKTFEDLEERATPSKVKELSEELKQWAVTTANLLESDNFIEGRDQEGTLRFLMGISRHGEYLVMDFVESDGTVGGYQLKAFYELLKLGLDYKLGIKYSDPNTRAVYLLAKEYNLELVGKYLVADYQTLAEAVGDI